MVLVLVVLVLVLVLVLALELVLVLMVVAVLRCCGAVLRWCGGEWQSNLRVVSSNGHPSEISLPKTCLALEGDRNQRALDIAKTWKTVVYNHKLLQPRDGTSLIG